jgi:calcineurin-like phosphoesterase family protein
MYYNIENIEDPEVKEILKKDFARIQYLMPYQYDVGVDKNNFTPLSFDEVKEKIDQQVKSYNEKIRKLE